MILPSDDTLVLNVTPDNPMNCRIMEEGGKVLYNINTDNPKEGTWTVVRNAYGEVIASLEWREVMADKVTFSDGQKAISLWSWLKRGLIPIKDEATFTDEQNNTYKWKGLSADKVLELYSSKSDKPIAWFAASKRSLNPQGSSFPPIWSQAQLFIEPSAMGIRDLVIAGFCFLEKQKRINNVDVNNAAVMASMAGGAAVYTNTWT